MAVPHEHAQTLEEGESIAFESIPFSVAIALLIVALLIIRFVIKTAITVVKIAALVFAGVGVYFLLAYFTGG